MTNRNGTPHDSSDRSKTAPDRNGPFRDTILERPVLTEPPQAPGAIDALTLTDSVNSIPDDEALRAAGAATRLRASHATPSAFHARERLAMKQEVSYVSTVLPKNDSHSRFQLERLVRTVGEGTVHFIDRGNYLSVYIAFSRERPPYRSGRFVKEAEKVCPMLQFATHDTEMAIIDVDKCPSSELAQLLDDSALMAHRNGRSLISENGEAAAAHPRVSPMLRIQTNKDFTIPVQLSSGRIVNFREILTIDESIRDPDQSEFAARKMYFRDKELKREVQKAMDFAMGKPVTASMISGRPLVGKSEFVNRMIIKLEEVFQSPEFIQRYGKCVCMRCPAIDDDRNKAFSYVQKKFLPALLSKTRTEGLQYAPDIYAKLLQFSEEENFTSEKQLVVALKTYFHQLARHVKVIQFPDDAQWQDILSMNGVLDQLFRSAPENLHTVLLRRSVNVGQPRVLQSTIDALGITDADKHELHPVDFFVDVKGKSKLHPQFIEMTNDMIGVALNIELDPKYIIHEGFLQVLAESSGGIPGNISYCIRALVQSGAISRDSTTGLVRLSPTVEADAVTTVNSVFANQANDLIRQYSNSAEVLSLILALSESGSSGFDLLVGILTEGKNERDAQQAMITLDSLGKQRVLSVTTDNVGFNLPDLPENLRALLQDSGDMIRAHDRIAQYLHESTHLQIAPTVKYHHASVAHNERLQQIYILDAYNEYSERLDYAGVLALYKDMQRLFEPEQLANPRIHLTALRAMVVQKDFEGMRQLGGQMYNVLYEKLMPQSQDANVDSAELDREIFGNIVHQEFTKENIDQLIELLDTMCDGYYMYVNTNRDTDVRENRLLSMETWANRFLDLRNKLNTPQRHEQFGGSAFYGMYDVLYKYHSGRTQYRKYDYEEAAMSFALAINSVKDFYADPRYRAIAEDLRVRRKGAAAERFQANIAYSNRTKLGTLAVVSGVGRRKNTELKKITVTSETLLEDLGNNSFYRRLLHQACTHMKSFLDQVQEDPRVAPDTRDVAYGFQTQGRILDQLGHFTESLDAFSEAANLANRLRDKNLHADVSMNKGSMYLRAVKGILSNEVSRIDAARKLANAIQDEETGGRGEEISLAHVDMFLLRHAAVLNTQAYGDFVDLKNDSYQFIAAYNASEIANIARVLHDNLNDRRKMLGDELVRSEQLRLEVIMKDALRMVTEAMSKANFQEDPAVQLDFAPMLVRQILASNQLKIPGVSQLFEHLRGPEGTYSGLHASFEALVAESETLDPVAGSAVTPEVLADYVDQGHITPQALALVADYLKIIQTRVGLMRHFLEKIVPAYEARRRQAATKQ